MALTYEESNALMADTVFRGRIKVACLGYAHYIMDEQPNVVAHNTRFRWAQNTYQQPDTVAQQMQPAVVMEPAVQNAGANIDDVSLQTAVETVVNKMM